MSDSQDKSLGTKVLQEHSVTTPTLLVAQVQAICSKYSGGDHLTLSAYHLETPCQLCSTAAPFFGFRRQHRGKLLCTLSLCQGQWLHGLSLRAQSPVHCYLPLRSACISVLEGHRQSCVSFLSQNVPFKGFSVLFFSLMRHPYFS